MVTAVETILPLQVPCEPPTSPSLPGLPFLFRVPDCSSLFKYDVGGSIPAKLSKTECDTSFRSSGTRTAELHSPPPAVRHVPHTKTRAVVREHSQHPLHHSLPPPSRTLRRVVTQQEQDHRKALNGFHNSG